jgi:peptidoglycan/LPS O-acetylase OafA/YrhL
MIERLKKLYPLLIIAFVFYFFYSIVLEWKMLEWFHYKEFLYKFLFIHTLVPESATTLSGPWWFFGLIFQLYVLFPLLFKALKKYNIKAFVLICVVSYIWIYISQYIYSPKADIMLLQNSPGYLPEFTLGILFALNPGKRIHFIWIVLAFVIFSLGNFYKSFFPLTFLSITVVMYWGLSRIMPFILNKTKIIKSVLFYYGSISMILFVIHGELRPRFISICGETFVMRYFSAILFLIAATALSILGAMMYKWMVKRLDFI